MSDLGLSAPGNGVQAEKLQGSISLKDGNLKIKELYGQIRNSPLSIKGTIRHMDNPDIDIAVSSSNLDIEDLLLLSKLEGTAKNKPSPTLKMKASIQATAGKFRDMEFKHLDASALLEDKILYLQQMEFSAFGGEASGRGGSTQAPTSLLAIQASFNLKAFQQKRLLGSSG